LNNSQKTGAKRKTERSERRKELAVRVEETAIPLIAFNDVPHDQDQNGENINHGELHSLAVDDSKPKAWCWLTVL